MSNLTCPKCGGSDSLISQRNIVKGRGIYQSAKIRGVEVCQVCDEIMTDRHRSFAKPINSTCFGGNPLICVRFYNKSRRDICRLGDGQYPSVIVYIFLSKYVTKGIALGGITK